MSRRNAPEIFFPRYGAAHDHAQEPTPGSAVQFWGKSVRKNRPLVPRSNIAGSWARGGGYGHSVGWGGDSCAEQRVGSGMPGGVQAGGAQ